MRVAFQRATGKATCVAEPKQEKEAKLDEPGESRIPTSYGQGYVCCRAKTSFAETKEEEAKLDEPENADELSFRAAGTQIWLWKS